MAGLFLRAVVGRAAPCSSAACKAFDRAIALADSLAEATHIRKHTDSLLAG